MSGERESSAKATASRPRKASRKQTRVVPTTVVDPGDGSLLRLLRTVGSLVDPDMPRQCLVGGLAVMARLASAHRVTSDIDAVSELTDAASALDLLVARGGTRRGASVEFDGVVVDVIEIGDFVPDDLPSDENERLFVFAHSWALATAENVELWGANETGRVVERVEVPVATVAALVAMKLVSIPNRSGHREVKRSSDCYDLYRLCLLDSARTPVAVPLAYSPGELATACRERIAKYLVDDAERTAGWIRQGSTFMATVSADELRAVGEPLIRRFDAAAVVAAAAAAADRRGADTRSDQPTGA